MTAVSPFPGKSITAAQWRSTFNPVKSKQPRMEPKDMDLSEFLLARIAEDEAVAREGGPELAEYGGGVGSELNYDSEYDDVTAQPARVLAECEAKRRIVEIASADWVPDTILSALALPYADHPDFDA